jgi:hypothetical protein
MLKEYPEEFRNLIMERAAPEAYVYALSFNHRKFPEHIWVYNGHEREGQSVAKMKLNFSDPNWWKPNYSGGKNRKTRRTKSNQSKQKKGTRVHKSKRYGIIW